MIENNYDILGVPDGSSKRIIQEAFRKLALEHHTDRGGNPEKFKKVKQAYEDLKIGKKYPDTDQEKQLKSRVYSGTEEEETRRRNQILAEEIFREVREAEEWLGALARSNATGTRLFGSKTMGEMEFERKATGTLLIKGNLMAGSLLYDGPVLMQGNITSPTFGEDYFTNIILTQGDFKFLNPLENKYKIENGAKITAEEGDIVVGNVFGRKIRIQDPDGRVGASLVREKRTSLHASQGKIVVENAADTVTLEGDTVIILTMEDDVRVTAREILIYGSKITYDVQINLKRGGAMRFFERYSVQGLSDDAKVVLEDGKTFRLRELKTKKIWDLADEFVPDKTKFAKDATMVGHGFSITYGMLDNFDKKTTRGGGGRWTSKIRFK